MFKCLKNIKCLKNFRLLFNDPESHQRRQMIWEQGLLTLMKRLKEGPEAIDTSSNKYQVNDSKAMKALSSVPKISQEIGPFFKQLIVMFRPLLDDQFQQLVKLKCT